MVGGFPPHQQQRHEGRPWRPASSRCKRHPHHALIGVCSICLKERLLALALELEEEEAKAHADLADHNGAPELEYLHGLHAASLEASHAAAEYINNARFSSYNCSYSGQRAPSQAQLQQLYHHQLANPYLQHTHKMASLNRTYGSQLAKKPSSAGASGSYRRYKSFASSPRHSSLQAQFHEHTLDRHIASTSPPPRSIAAMAARTTQPQMLHWRTSPNEVSPISLSGLNNFISSVKATESSEAEPKKKKKSTSLWSLLQKPSASSQDTEEWTDRPFRKGSVQGSPQGRSRGPDSSSMREVHVSLCRGDASSLLSSPRKVGANTGGNLPSSLPTATQHSHCSAAQMRRGGHWRSNSCIGDNYAFDTIHEEGMIRDNVQQGASNSPSWLPSIFHKKSRTRSRSISTACNSSPDLNAVMTASASAKYGRFSVDAAASANSRHHDADKQDARFRKKYASLFEEANNPKAVKKRSGGCTNTSRWSLKEEEHGCQQCEEVKAGRMKLARFLAAQVSTHEGNEKEVFETNAGGDLESVQVPARSSPRVSPGRKVTEEDMALSPGVYRMSASNKSHGGNALVYNSSAANATSTSPDHMQAALSPIVTSADGVAPLDSESEEKTQSLSRLHNVPRSRSWSKSWNKALSPMLSFKGKAASPSRKIKGAMIGDAQLGIQLNAEELIAGVPPIQSPRQEGVDADSKRAPQHYSFLSKDYSAFSFYFSPLRRSRRKLAAEAGGGGGGGNMSSARVNALSDQAAFSGLHTHFSSRHSVDGSCWPSTTHPRHR